MKRKNHIRAALMVTVAAMCAVVTSCREKESILDFQCQMDNWTATSANGAKLNMQDCEQNLRWESDDEIYAFVGDGGSICDLVTGEGSMTAYFKSRSELPSTEAHDAYAIYPASDAVTGNRNRIKLPSEYTYRDYVSTFGDSSFAATAMPMVSWMDCSDESPNDEYSTQDKFSFHVVAGVVRLQLYSTSMSAITLDYLQLTEVGSQHSGSDKQLSGIFGISNDAWTSPNPWLTSASSSDADKTVKINFDNSVAESERRILGGANAGSLYTFYIPLPALQNRVKYDIRLKVKGHDASDNSYYVSRDFSVYVQRRNITMVPALVIKEWKAGDGDELTGENTDVQYVGNGTKDRPFRIYSAQELGELRFSMRSGGTINGQPVTKDTYFEIVRSDIVLTEANWAGGIKNFIGHITIRSNTAQEGFITNNSKKPIFESISEDGVVENIFVKGDQEFAANAHYSPLCLVNNGVIAGCHNGSKIILTSNHYLSGICVTNNGLIQGCDNDGDLHVENSGVRRGVVAGVCLFNNDTIKGCYKTSSAAHYADSTAGICYENNGVITECQSSVNPKLAESRHRGLVCFRNGTNGIIQYCNTSGNSVRATGALGGISYINDGVIRCCKNVVSLEAQYDVVGGVVAYQRGGEIYNCCAEESVHGIAIIACHDGNTSTDEYAGGIVGRMTGGTLRNCYAHCHVDVATNCGGIIGQLIDGDIQNCWSAGGHKFFGKLENEMEPGINSFSAAINDYENNHCSMIDTGYSNTYFRVHATNVMARDAAYAESAKGDLLMTALNNWVNDNSTNKPAGTDADAYYYKWKQSSRRPQFDDPKFNSIDAKKKLLRRK